MERGRIHIIIVAGGSGSRFGADVPKQYCLLAGRPVLMHTICSMRSALPDAEITLVVSASMEAYWRELCARHSFESPRLVHGGATRSESVRNAMRSLSADTDIVLVHDGARPLTGCAVVEAVVEAVCRGADGAIPAVAVTDSLRMVHADGTNTAADRSAYRAVQTPQAFDAKKLAAAYASTAENFSDDASLMEHCGHSDIVLTQGEPSNIKITNPMDLSIAELLLTRE